MPDAATIAAGLALINVAMNGILLSGMWKLISVYKESANLYRESTKHLKDMLEVYDPDKVNRTMRAFKEREELASQNTIGDLQRRVDASDKKEALLIQFASEYSHRYEAMKSFVAFLLLNNPAERELFFTQEALQRPIMEEVRARMDELKVKGLRELEPVDRRGLAGLVYSLFPHGLPPPSEPTEQ